MHNIKNDDILIMNFNHVENCLNNDIPIDEPEYLEGKIYIIYCKCDRYKIYIGSTVNKLSKRLNQHIVNNDCNTKYLCKCDLKIEELINVKFYNRKSLNELECYYINLYKNDENFIVVNN